MKKQNVAELIVSCLEEEGVKYVFGIPGEENIKLVNAIHKSDKIKFILVRHEQGASFMADIYGRLTGNAGVCTATLGPGAINLLLGVTDANTDSAPVVAISAQVGLNRIYKESHQIVDLLSMFKPVTKWADTILTSDSVPEMVRKAFDQAQSERPGATYLAVPQDIEAFELTKEILPLKNRPKHTTFPDIELVKQAVEVLKTAKNPVILVGHGVVRGQAQEEVRELCEKLKVPVATTFMAKGAVSDKKEYVLGVVGFMNHDYENFAFDQADVILSIGYELEEFAPSRINPKGDKKIIHINTFTQDVDVDFDPEVTIKSDIKPAVKELSKQLETQNLSFSPINPSIKGLLEEERKKGEEDNSYPVKPQRVVNAIREVLGDEDIVLADTGAVKMWMARLYPAYQPNTCIISNGLSTMSFSLPGGIGAHFAFPNKKILATMGDGSFMMNSQELETAVREKVPLKILIWEDNAYGLIKWKMDMELKTHDDVDFTNPDFVKYAESFGAKGHKVSSAEELVPTLQKALKEEGVSVVVCPVDYSENMKLTQKLGELSMPN